MAYPTLHGLEPIHLRDYHTLTAADMCGRNVFTVVHSLQMKSMHPPELCLQHFLHAQISSDFFLQQPHFYSGEVVECGWEVHREDRCLLDLGSDLNDGEV